MKKIGTIVHYFPADKDEQIIDCNGSSFFPAVITQENEGGTHVNLCVFSWNGIAPVLNICQAPDDFDPQQPRDVGVYKIIEPDDVVDLGNAGSRIEASIKETQKMIEDHAAMYEAANKKIIDDTDLVNQYAKDLSNRVAELEKVKGKGK